MAIGRDTPGTPKRMCRGVRFGRIFLDFLEFGGLRGRDGWMHACMERK